MFDKAQWIASLCAFCLFVVAQQQGWSLFEESAQPARGSSGSGRVHHK